MNLEKAVNHGGHGEHAAKQILYLDSEKTRSYVSLSNHPLGARKKIQKLKLFAVPAVFAVVELRF